eukprot:17551-Rhodomonas_salina.1
MRDSATLSSTEPERGPLAWSEDVPSEGAAGEAVSGWAERAQAGAQEEICAGADAGFAVGRPAGRSAECLGLAVDEQERGRRAARRFAPAGNLQHDDQRGPVP